MRLVRGLVAAWLLLLACGGSSSNGDDDVDLPGRNGDAGDDVVDAGHDVAAPPADTGADVVAPPLLCKESDLVLCLPFEGNFVDGSPNAFVPSVTDSISFIPGKAGQAASFSQVSALRYAASTLFNLTAATVESVGQARREQRRCRLRLGHALCDDGGRHAGTLAARATIRLQAARSPWASGCILHASSTGRRSCST